VRKPVDEVNRLLESGRRKMIQARQARRAPAVDRSIHSDWNGMMVSSYLKAYATLGHEEARAFALKTLDFILKRLATTNAGIYHSLIGSERLVSGLLDDQVMMARALLDAYEVTGEPVYLARARQIMVWTIEHLWDAKGGGFFDSAPNPAAAGLLAIPRKEIRDTPSTSGNAVAAQVLNRLYYLTQETRFRDFARRTIEAFAGRTREEGTLVDDCRCHRSNRRSGRRHAAPGGACDVPAREDRDPRRARSCRSKAIARRGRSRPRRHRSGALAAGPRLLGDAVRAADSRSNRRDESGQEFRTQAVGSRQSAVDLLTPSR
jgi:uncharacterized protein YyaL (SSP411 family)